MVGVSALSSFQCFVVIILKGSLLETIRGKRRW